DPNTQVDWWIAQCWQQAQAGMGEESLVSWLHENGLTAKSSFIIIQAALNCNPAHARRLVYDHPVWADSGE
ncbi:MAG: hypothetical protein GWN85_03615, partial [Gemmatimonadetes bacterium]|nr:hypothetical protein [Gemmatimonadota bacterium]